MMRLMTLEVRLMLDPQLLVKRRKTLPPPPFQAVLMAEIPVVAQPLPVGRSMLHRDARLRQQGFVETGQFGGEGQPVTASKPAYLVNRNDIPVPDARQNKRLLS